MGWEGDVLNKNVNRLKVDAAQAAKSGLLGLIGVGTGGNLGRLPEGQQPVADRNGVLPRAATTGAEASKQANESLRRFGQQHGIGVPEQTGQTGLGKFLGDIGDAFSRRILPSDGMVNRLKNGAAAATVAVSGLAAGGVALAQDGVEAVKTAASQPTAAVQRSDPAKGIYIERGADGQPAVAVNARAIEAEADKPSLWDRFKNAFSSEPEKTAGVATAKPPEPANVEAAPEAVSKGINLSTLEPKVIPPTTVPSTPAIVAPPITEQFTAAAKETFIDMRDNKNAPRIDADTYARARAAIAHPVPDWHP